MIVSFGSRIEEREGGTHRFGSVEFTAHNRNANPPKQPQTRVETHANALTQQPSFDLFLARSRARSICYEMHELKIEYERNWGVPETVSTSFSTSCSRSVFSTHQYPGCLTKTRDLMSRRNVSSSNSGGGSGSGESRK